MARRSISLFSLSLLDLLTSALGAVIFLFIITPKGGNSAGPSRQAMIYFDTLQMKIHGELPDSLLSKQTGDTLFTVLLDYKNLPLERKTPPKPILVKEKVPAQTEVLAPKEKVPNAKVPEVKKKAEPIVDKTTPPEKKETLEKVPTTKPSTYKGDAPSVPCKASIEIYWPSKAENIDLVVCKEESCVYGARKRDKKIGQWDSGRSRNRIFGNDLRTNQEAVRQFDQIIPGRYKIYAQYKDSKTKKAAVQVKGLIYTKNNRNQERGESFGKQLYLNNKKRVLIGVLFLKEDGTFQFQKQ